MENLDVIMQYSPIIMLVLVYLIQMKIFVTPEALEKKHREIMLEAERRFAPILSVEELRGQIFEIKDKIDKIYNFFMREK